MQKSYTMAYFSRTITFDRFTVTKFQKITMYELYSIINGDEYYKCLQ